MIQTILLAAAYLIDRLIGDPRWLTHPVVWIGKAIGLVERTMRTFARRERALKLAGVLLVALIVGGAYFFVWGLLRLVEVYVHPSISFVLAVWIVSTTVATKGLADAGMEIFDRLKRGQVDEARKSLSMVVGRDTATLDEPEISRGAVETVAENIVDAIVSPLFYAAIGGAPLAMAYRAVNTLDSMVGYKNERYLHFGWASARFDDVANFIPARLAGWILVVVCWMMRLNWRACRRVIRRDARLHPSPNSGITESGVAGALGIQLGGTNYYQGVPSERAKMGEPLRSIEAEDIRRTVVLMKRVSLGSLIVGMLIGLFVNWV